MMMVNYGQDLTIVLILDYWDIIGDINLKPNDLRNALLMIIVILLKITCSNQGKLSALLSCHPIRTGN